VQIADEGDRMLWSLWAAKEAAFKALVREDPTTIFSPQAIEVETSRDRSPSVSWGVRRWSVSWAQGPDWVHAWVGEGWLPAVEAFQGDESIAVRALAERTAEAAGWGRGRVGGRPPSLSLAGRSIPVSLSHDGPWVAVVVPLPKP
jgi:phosphopantetheinyl transferase (holo-ACP synthase)